MVVLAGLKRPERKMTDVPAGHRLVKRCWSAPTRVGASHGLTDHLPARRGILDRVRLERVGAHRDPRHHGRAMCTLRRPGAWAPHPHVRSPSHEQSAGTAWPNGAPHGRKHRPRKPVPRPVGWHMGEVGLAPIGTTSPEWRPKALFLPGCFAEPVLTSGARRSLRRLEPHGQGTCQPTSRAPPGTREALIGRRGSPMASVALRRVIGQWDHRARHRDVGRPARPATRPHRYLEPNRPIAL
jgi:hypothetical protein